MHFLAFASRALYRLRGACFGAIIRAAGGRCGPGLRVEAGLRLRHGAHSGLAIGRNVYLGASTVIDCPAGGTLTIGDGVTLTHGAFVSALKSVSIGAYTLIGEYVSIRDADHQIEVGSGPIRDQPMSARGCRIGSDVWIGRGCAVLSGACIEDGCVIGANSVVKGEIPALSIAVGSPAVVRRQRPGAADLAESA
jgi:acetyltransferase-like isoleucine patch superfamily enzyme